MAVAATTVNVTGTVTAVPPRGPELDQAVIGAGRQGAGCYAYGHGTSSSARVRSVPQPGGVMTDTPVQGAAAGVTDTECLRGGVAAALDRRECETRWTRADDLHVPEAGVAVNQLAFSLAF